jgi:hypothetical protein
MSIPVAERIAQKAFERVRKLTAQFSTHTIVSEVVRPTARGGYTPKHKQIIQLETLTLNPEHDRPGSPPALGYDLDIEFHVNLNPSEHETTPIKELMHYVNADVVKVITSPAASWHNWDGLALNSVFQEPTNELDPDGGVTRIIVPLKVTFRTSETDPYTARG